MTCALFAFVTWICSSSGPNLNGLIGRQTGQVPDFDYTEANKKKGNFLFMLTCGHCSKR